jgi:peptidoglycan/LPS O-acetylase OafA/YrhL
MIVIQHSASYFHILEDFTHKFTLIQGVTFFFVLSGFILTYAHHSLEGAANSARFIWARIARVWPVHAFTMGLLYFLWVYPYATGLTVSTQEVLLNISLLQAWSQLPSNFFAFNGVAWTLSVEMFFYAMFPLLIFNFNKTWHIKLGMAAFLAITGVRIAIESHAPIYTTENVASVASWTYIWPVTRLFEFVLGMTAGHAFIKYGHKIRDSKYSGAFGVASLVVLLGAAWLVPALGWSLEASGAVSPATRSWIAVSGSSIFFAVSLFMLAPSVGIVTNILKWKPLVLLGEISFSIYMIHQLVVRSLMINPSWTEGVPAGWAMAGYWAFVIAASYVTWRLVEKPCQRAMVSLFKKSPAPATLAQRA